MDPVFAAIEQTPFSVWMREDFYAYFIALIFHSIGMALLIGGGVVIALRMIGVAGHTRIEKFRGFFPVMWFGAVMAIVSGIALLIGYPAKALTNPLFGVKFACLIGAALLVRHASRKLFPAAEGGEVLPPVGRSFGIAMLMLWLGGVTAGKLLLHTYTILMVS
ncbi:MAG: hypothetical protein ABL956_17505 [Hyphomonadaceae bacterium]